MQTLMYKISYKEVFPGDLVVETSPSSSGAAGSIPDQCANPTCFAAKKPKHKTEAIL